MSVQVEGGKVVVKKGEHETVVGKK
jgi:hypothetical protein